MLGKLSEWIIPSQSSFDTSAGLRQAMLGSQVLLAIQQISDLSRKAESLKTFLESSLSILKETTDFPLIAIELHHSPAQALSIAASTDGENNSEEFLALERDDSSLEISKLAISSHQTQINFADDQTEWEQTPLFPFSEPKRATIQTLIKIPMVINQEVIGLLDLAHPERIEDPEQQAIWGESLAHYIGSLIHNYQLEERKDRYRQRLQWIGNTLQGFTYSWDLITGEVKREPKVPQVFDISSSPDLASMDNWLQLIHPDDRQAITDQFESIWKQEGNYHLTYRICEESNQVIEVTDQGTVIRNEDDQPVQVIGCILKTTASSPTQLIAEPASFAEHKSISPDIQRSQRMLNNIKTVIFNTDLEGYWVYLNPAWTALTGYLIDESIGESFIDLVAPEDQQSTLDAFQSLLDGQTDCYSQEVRLITKSGTERWLSMEIQATLSDDGQLIGTYGSFHDISDYKNTEAQLLQNALYDSLTGLPNRVLFLERLRHTYRAYRRNHDNLFTVFFLDVDSFKSINDTHGHLMGDKVLIEVAERLVACLRPADTTARLGGDEFTILLPQINARDDVAEIATRILSSLSEPYHFGDTTIQTSATIGVAVCAHPYEQPEDLLRNADIALYQAKASGKGQYVVFQPSMHVESASQQQLESNLRQVLDSQDFKVDYQPIFDLQTESMIGVEAVIRWTDLANDEHQGNNLMNAAETSGLSGALSWKLIETACQQVTEWQQKFEMTSLRLSVPLSLAQLRESGVRAKLSALLSRHKLKPQQLQIDLVGVIDSLDDSTLRSHLEELKSLGISLSLSQVQNISPGSEIAEYGGRWIDALKLDPVLVREIEVGNNLEVLRTVLAMGHKFQCRVQSTSISSAKQLAQLRAFQCEEGQGSLFGMPMQADVIEARWIELTAKVDEMTSSLNSPALLMNSDMQQSQLSLFGRQAWSIGRSNESAIVLPDRWVSRHHAELQCMSNGDVYFVDLGSGNGSYVNGERVTLPVLLQKGDRLTVGQTDIDFITAPSNLPTDASDPSSGLTAPKTVLMMQSSKLQGEVWRESLISQGISLIWLQPNVDLVQLLEHRAKSGQPLPDLLLLDMTIIKPNPYSFCRWCGQEYDDLNIILTSGSRGHVPPSERQWAINQGAKDLLPAFPERNLFGNMVDVVTNVRIVLTALDIEPTDQSSLSEVLMSLKTSMNRATLH